ncbi:hypothetical protein [Streptomonospora nanhaiensis]|uniref:DUF2567 domain-containing protein n=2 Tax=Streptomonospora nanhaiensis TaxID=1323731 RepID=A0A853BHF3_9ACTN|nr:hypothetical protein [Streptomonospora nanhaiensis]MBV2362529.1 hypothetical protein [Streptomonospora nanhaiensis]NYI94809.1 hypothetical protein [Streptomonospora nanhaiensis]
MFHPVIVGRLPRPDHWFSPRRARARAGGQGERSAEIGKEDGAPAAAARPRQLRTAAAVAGAVTALGPPLGGLWWLVAPRPDVTVGTGGEVLPYPVTETTFAVDGWFALMAMAAGLVCGYAAYMVQYRLAARVRADLRLACLLGLALGSAAGSAAAWQTGTLLDAAQFADAVAAAEPGDVVESGLRLQALSALVAWPFVAVLQYGLFDAVSLWRGDVPGARPPEDPGEGGGDPPGPAGPHQGAGPADGGGRPEGTGSPGPFEPPGHPGRPGGADTPGPGGGRA